MAGRKPIPTKLKQLKGTARKSRINKHEPKPEAVVPLAPNHLSILAIAEWDRVTGELYSLGLLSQIDRASLAAYCQAYGRWVQAEKELNEQGLTITTSNGNVIQNPLVGTANRAMELMHKFLTEFGMSPSSRARVSATPPQEKSDDLAMFGI